MTVRRRSNQWEASLSKDPLSWHGSVARAGENPVVVRIPGTGTLKTSPCRTRILDRSPARLALFGGVGMVATVVRLNHTTRLTLEEGEVCPCLLFSVHMWPRKCTSPLPLRPPAPRPIWTPAVSMGGAILGLHSSADATSVLASRRV